MSSSIRERLGFQRGSGLDPWHRQAACADYPLSRFFEEVGSNQREKGKPKAQRICARCPVRRDCLAEALHFEQGRWEKDAKGHDTWVRRNPVGVYGGHDERTRWSRAVTPEDVSQAEDVQRRMPTHPRSRRHARGVVPRTSRFVPRPWRTDRMSAAVAEDFEDSPEQRAEYAKWKARKTGTPRKPAKLIQTEELVPDITLKGQTWTLDDYQAAALQEGRCFRVSLILRADGVWQYRDGRRWKCTLLEVQGIGDQPKHEARPEAGGAAAR